MPTSRNAFVAMRPRSAEIELRLPVHCLRFVWRRRDSQSIILHRCHAAEFTALCASHLESERVERLQRIANERKAWQNMRFTTARTNKHAPGGS